MITHLMLAAALLAPVPLDDVTVHTGHIQGAEFRVEVPARWNGTVLLYSHGSYPDGYLPPQPSLTAQAAAKPVLLSRGYALAASNYSDPHGYAIPEALHDQMALLDWFGAQVGKPRRVISWGASQGGLAATMLEERNSRRIDGAVAMCGSLGGAVGKFNLMLDTQFVVKTLLDPSLSLVGVSDPAANTQRATQVMRTAVQTPAGRARLALAAAVGSVPGWSRAHEPRPADVPGQVAAQAGHLTRFAWFMWGAGRTDIEEVAGGNPSWNAGIDYRRQLARAAERPLVLAAYREAGLDLEADLTALSGAPRVSPDPAAVGWLARHGTLTGRGGPVVTLHPVGDTVGPEHEREYGERARDSRQLFVSRGGHCMHTAAEELTALDVLETRISTGRWPVTDPGVLNRAAGAYRAETHVLHDWTVDRTEASSPAFTSFAPGEFLR